MSAIESSSDSSSENSSLEEKLSLSIQGLNQEETKNDSEIQETSQVRDSIRRIGEVPNDFSTISRDLTGFIENTKPVINIELKVDLLKENIPEFIEPVFNVQKDSSDEEQNSKVVQAISIPSKSEEVKEPHQKGIKAHQTSLNSSSSSSDEEPHSFPIKIEYDLKKEENKETPYQSFKFSSEIYKVESIWLPDNELSIKTFEVIISE